MTKLNKSAYGGNTHFQEMINNMKPYTVHCSPNPISRMIKFRRVYQEYILTLGLTSEQRDTLIGKIEDFATASFDAGASNNENL